MNYQKISLIAAKNNKAAQQTKELLIKKYNFSDITESLASKKAGDSKIDSDLILVIGGDGLMLKVLHWLEYRNIPLYGINCGTVGFLMNSPCETETSLMEKLHQASTTKIKPLRADIIDINEVTHSNFAINEVSLIRQTSQAAKIKIEVNGKERLSCLHADGIMVATPAGSTAYNFSAGGPIIPFGAQIFALTAISPFRPKHWSCALLPSNSIIDFTIISPETRPVSSTSDSQEVRNVKSVKVFEDKRLEFGILFDQDHSLEERIIKEQFNR